MDIWEIIKIVVSVVAPFIAFYIWIFKKHHMRVDKLESRVTNVERSTAVIQVMVDNIKDDIKEIKHGIEKILDRK